MAEYATVVDRGVAFFIDGILTGIIGMVIAVPLFMTMGLSVFAMQNLGVSDPAMAGGVLVSVFAIIGVMSLVTLLYYVYFEGSSGQTPGKKVMKIKVTGENGKPIDYGPAMLRNILRIIDGLPFLYIIGIILIASTDNKQRLGDMIAHSIVVKA